MTQAVLDVIENPDVARALRQDMNQNRQYIKDNYDVSFFYAFLASSRSLSWNKSLRSATLDTSSIRMATIVMQLTTCTISVSSRPTTRQLTGENSPQISSLENGLEELNTLCDVIDSRTPYSLHYIHRSRCTNPAPLPDVACPLIVVCVFQPPTYIPQCHPDGSPVDTSVPSECRDPIEKDIQ